MNIRYTLDNIIFEWNNAKASSNLRKHGVSFELACTVFFDPFLRGVNDVIIDGELREAVIGMTAN